MANSCNPVDVNEDDKLLETNLKKMMIKPQILQKGNKKFIWKLHGGKKPN